MSALTPEEEAAKKKGEEEAAKKKGEEEAKAKGGPETTPPAAASVTQNTDKVPLGGVVSHSPKWDTLSVKERSFVLATARASGLPLAVRREMVRGLAADIPEALFAPDPGLTAQAVKGAEAALAALIGAAAGMAALLVAVEVGKALARSVGLLPAAAPAALPVAETQLRKPLPCGGGHASTASADNLKAPCFSYPRNKSFERRLPCRRQSSSPATPQGRTP